MLLVLTSILVMGLLPVQSQSKDELSLVDLLHEANAAQDSDPSFTVTISEKHSENSGVRGYITIIGADFVCIATAYPATTSFAAYTVETCIPVAEIRDIKFNRPLRQ